MNTPYKSLPTYGGRFFQFAYLIPPSNDERDEMPYKTRDAEAGRQLQNVLEARGYRYAGSILNYARTDEEPGPEPDLKALELGPSDLLVLTTRPPLNDGTDANRLTIHPSDTKLEQMIFACVRKHLTHCSRTKVDIHPLHAQSSEAIGQLASVTFRQNRGADMDKINNRRTHRKAKAPPNATLAYHIFDPSVWKNGPALLVSFGMCGTDTLAWNYLLATRYPEMIARVPFFVGAFTDVKRPSRPTMIDYANDWSLSILQPDAPEEALKARKATLQDSLPGPTSLATANHED